jgi:hypothetical protein
LNLAAYCSVCIAAAVRRAGEDDAPEAPRPSGGLRSARQGVKRTLVWEGQLDPQHVADGISELTGDDPELLARAVAMLEHRPIARLRDAWRALDPGWKQFARHPLESLGAVLAAVEALLSEDTPPQQEKSDD